MYYLQGLTRSVKELTKSVKEIKQDVHKIRLGIKYLLLTEFCKENHCLHHNDAKCCKCPYIA